MAVGITVRNNQSMFDLAIQEAGTVEAISDLMDQNNISPTDDLAPGDKLVLEAIITSTDIQRYFKSNNIHPATGITTIGEAEQTGISVWAVNEDFIIE